MAYAIKLILNKKKTFLFKINYYYKKRNLF
jgi:hypothetical protein